MSGRKPTFLLVGKKRAVRASCRWRSKIIVERPMALSMEQIRQTADRVAASLGLDVVDVEYLGGSKHRVLRVYIEQNAAERTKRAAEAAAKRAEDGQLDEEQKLLDHLLSEGLSLEQLAWITHEDCERFSRDFGTVVDVEDLVKASEYTLEVSSPGLDRKLATREDYQRFQASSVKVRTFAPVAGNRHWLGRLTEVRADGIVLDLSVQKPKGKKKASATEQTVEITFANIEKANLAPEI